MASAFSVFRSRILAVFRNTSLSLLAGVMAPQVFAQAIPHMVKDLNTKPLPYEGDFRAIGKTIYLAGYTRAGGYELWKSDGTRAGTGLLKELSPGPVSSNPRGFTQVGNTVFFAAHRQEPWTGMELWKTDGTSRGTVLVKDINPENSSNPENFFAWKKQLWFTADDGAHGKELWKSDGTAIGTTLVKNIAKGSGNTEISEFTPLNGELFFVAYADGDSASRLWKTDGTTGNTRLVTPGKFQYPSELAVLGKLLYFTAVDNASGKRRLWKSDGTAKGTSTVFDLDLEYSTQVMRFGSRIIFAEGGSGSGGESGVLYSTDGTAKNTKLISNAGFLRAFGIFKAPGESKASLYFSGGDWEHGIELWKSDGTAARTRVFKDLSPGRGDSYPIFFSPVEGKMFFTASRNGDGGNVLWSTKGTAATTKALKVFTRQIFLQKGIGDSVLFLADDGRGSGDEIWTSDGTTSGTVPLTDFMGTADSRDFSLCGIDGNKFRFWADTHNDYSQILYETDGTAGGTKELPALTGYCSMGGAFFFQGINQITDFDWDYELFISDGTEAGVKELKNINPQAKSSSYPADFNALGNIVCFTADDGTHGRELWRSDGTEAGTFMIKDLVPGAKGADPRDFIKIGNILYFILPSDGGLWRTDGTAEGTIMLAPDQGLGNLRASGDTLLFDNGVYRWIPEPILWRSDGTPQGTFQVSTAPEGTMPLTAGIHYFLMPAPYENGVDLWRGDGTAGGTYKVSHMAGTFTDGAAEVMSLGGRVVFWITRGGRNELWCSDGTGPGTRMIRSAGDQSRGICFQAVADHSLFFVTGDSEQDYHLWKSDGTSDGTGLVLVDLGGPIVYPSKFWIAGNNLYFPMETEKYGTELHAISVGDLRIARSGFGAWGDSQGLTGELAASLATPFGDGVENLLKYAFFMDGSHSDRHVMIPSSGTSGLPFFSNSPNPGGGNVLRVEYVRRKNSGLIYRPLFSSSLTTGSYVPMNGTPVVTDVDATRERVVVEHTMDPADGSAGFGVIEVSK